MIQQFFTRQLQEVVEFLNPVLHIHGNVALGLKFGKIVMIDKLVTGIIGRINVNHLAPMEGSFAKNFEDIEIVALDVKIFGCIEVNRFFTARAQS